MKSPEATPVTLFRFAVSVIWFDAAILLTAATVKAFDESLVEPVSVASVKITFIPTSNESESASVAKSRLVLAAGVAPTTPIAPD